MQSRTSYFNKAIFLNTLKRFWPLWLAYFAVWTLVLPVTSAVNYLGDVWRVQRDVLEISQQAGIIVNLGYGALAAMAVWSFMYNSKTMSGVACLPIKREGVFLSVTLAGLIPAIVANHMDAQLVHEAAIGKIAGDQILKLMTLGLTEEEAEQRILEGFLS